MSEFMESTLYVERKKLAITLYLGRISFNNTVESRFFNHLWKKQIGSNYWEDLKRSCSNQ